VEIKTNAECARRTINIWRLATHMIGRTCHADVNLLMVSDAVLKR